MKTDFSKEEFMTMALLYAAYVDHDINYYEVESLLRTTQREVLIGVSKQIGQMGEAEVINFFNQQRKVYASSKEERKKLIEEMRAMIEADNRICIIEVRLCEAVESLLCSDVLIPARISGL